MPIFASFVTILVGFFAAGIFDNWMNWPDAGAVFAIATMGAFLMGEVRKLTREEQEELYADPWKKREREAEEQAKSDQEDSQP